MSSNQKHNLREFIKSNVIWNPSELDNTFVCAEHDASVCTLIDAVSRNKQTWILRYHGQIKHFARLPSSWVLVGYDKHARLNRKDRQHLATRSAKLRRRRWAKNGLILCAVSAVLLGIDLNVGVWTPPELSELRIHPDAVAVVSNNSTRRHSGSTYIKVIANNEVYVVDAKYYRSKYKTVDVSRALKYSDTVSFWVEEHLPGDVRAWRTNTLEYSISDYHEYFVFNHRVLYYIIVISGILGIGMIAYSFLSGSR